MSKAHFSVRLLVSYRRSTLSRHQYCELYLWFFAMSISHGLLDALVGSSLGVAFFWPFDVTRYGFAWQPLIDVPIQRMSIGPGTGNAATGTPEAKDSKITAAKDVYDLITPSKERALMLNKAYWVIVEDQDFIYGREATVTPPKNVYRHVDNDTAPTLPESRTFKWDIRLNWAHNTK